MGEEPRLRGAETAEQEVDFIVPVRKGDLVGIGGVVFDDGKIAVSESDIRPR